VLSLLLVCIWQQVFHLPPAIILYHMAVAVPIHIFSITAISLIYARMPYRWYLVLKLGTWSLMVSLFYLLIFGSMYFWGDIITIKILGTYLAGFSSFLRSMPFSYTEMCIAICVFVAMHYIVVFVFAKSIGRALLDISASVTAHKKAVLALLVILLVATPLLIKAKRIIHKAGEPLMVMLFDHMWGVTDNPLFTQRRIRVGFEDNLLRKQYASTARAGLRKNVILIIVDALRADHLSAYGYQRATSPFIDSLIHIHQAAKVSRCYSTCACTLGGVTSILLSRTWNECAVNGFNIIGLLKDQKYHTYAFISGAHKEWYNMAKFYSDDCDLYFDGKDSKKYYFKDDRVLLEGLDRVKPYTDSAAFFYFHLQSTHETGLLQERYTVYKPFKKSITTKNMNTAAAVNEYDDKVLQADDIIRQLFQALDQKGYLKNSLVIITADHGQGLGEHGVSGHVDWLYDPQVSVPLIIYDDSLPLYHNLTFARHIDIAATIVGRLGLPKPSSWMGTSLLNPSITQYSYHETGKNGLETGLQKYMLVSYQDTALYKYIFTQGFKKEELYNVMADPGELNNLCASQKSILSSMRSVAKANFRKAFGDK
jgi:glucan phosphoethanolaminetransferase (alkaline phosphatase superfamily)